MPGMIRPCSGSNPICPMPFTRIARTLKGGYWYKMNIFLLRKKIFPFFFSLFLFGEYALAIEEPEYSVEHQSSHYEIRAYSPMLVAETTMQSGFEEAGNQAFRILAGYIFGNNRSKAKIGRAHV